MEFDGIVLYGPPASGKTTVCGKLTELNPRCSPLRRLKVGGGDPGQYRLIDSDQLARYRSRGRIVYENTRYGAVYAVDRLALRSHRDRTPIVQLGQIAGIEALRPHGNWLTVLLWCSLPCARHRLRARGTTNVEQRVQAWHETQADLVGRGMEYFDMSFRTDRVPLAAVIDSISTVLDGRAATADATG